MASNEGFIDKLFRKASDQLQDLSYIEVITAAGPVSLKINPDADDIMAELDGKQMELLARTKIELDGDIVMILPTKKGAGTVTVDPQIMSIHYQNMQAAVENWKAFVDTVLAAIELIARMAGLGSADIRGRMGISTLVAPKPLTVDR